SSFMIASLLNSKMVKWKVFFRTGFFIPVVSTTAIIGVVMKIILSAGENGAFNSLLINLGIIDEPVSWLLNSTSEIISIMVVGAWLFFGMCMVYWLAILQSLPADVYEAAKIDGANSFKSFWYITVPLILPAALVVLLLSIMHGLNAFDLILTLTGGGPFFATRN